MGESGVPRYVLHPGPGEVAAVRGLEEARAVPGVRRVHLRVGAGDHIAPRTGSGQDVGFVEVEGADRDEVARTLRAATAALRIEMAPSPRPA